MGHWALEPQDALRALDAVPEGLSDAEALLRLERYGPNELEEGRRGRAAAIALGQFTSPLIAILLVAAVVTVLLGEYVDAGVIAAVLVLNAIIGSPSGIAATASATTARKSSERSSPAIEPSRNPRADGEVGSADHVREARHPALQWRRGLAESPPQPRDAPELGRRGGGDDEPRSRGRA